MAGNKPKVAKTRKHFSVLWWIALVFSFIWLIITVTPFIFMVLNSFRKQFDMLQQGVFHLPDPWTFENYVEVVSNGFFGYFMRSVLVVAVSLVLMLIISAFAAYPLSRMNFSLRELLYAGIVAMMSVPMHVTLIPVFKLTTDMGLYDSLKALIGPYVAFALPMSVFILVAFMKTIPRELEEAAEIDGCGRFRNFFMIILPLSKPGLATIGLFYALNYWNQWFNAMLYIEDNKLIPLQYLLMRMLRNMDAMKEMARTVGIAVGEVPANSLRMATTVVVIGPIVLLYPYAQKYFTSGLTVGAIKG